MMYWISAQVNDDLLEKIKNHPLRGNRTQAEFYCHIFAKFVDSPESRVAILEQRVRSLQFQADFVKQRIDQS
jgi:hypothetical protein